jgi:hypothetical protein
VENLQLRLAFLGKPLIKTYVTLRESCRSTAPLQLCFWEIFHLVDNFWSFAISKRAKRIKNRAGRRRPRALERAGVLDASATCRSRDAPAYGRPRRLRGRPRTRCGPSAHLYPVRRAPTGGRAGQGATRRAPGHAAHAPLMQGSSWPHSAVGYPLLVAHVVFLSSTSSRLLVRPHAVGLLAASQSRATARPPRAIHHRPALLLPPQAPPAASPPPVLRARGQGRLLARLPRHSTLRSAAGAGRHRFRPGNLLKPPYQGQ